MISQNELRRRIAQTGARGGRQTGVDQPAQMSSCLGGLAPPNATSSNLIENKYLKGMRMFVQLGRLPRPVVVRDHPAADGPPGAQSRSDIFTIDNEPRALGDRVIEPLRDQVAFMCLPVDAR